MIDPAAHPDAIESVWNTIVTRLSDDPPAALAQAQACVLQVPPLHGRKALFSRFLLGRAQQANMLLDEARETLLAVAREAEELGDSSLEAQARTHLGKVLLDLGEFGGAGEELRRAVVLTEHTGGPAGIRAAALNHLAAVNHQQGHTSTALGLLNEALTLRELEGDVTGQIQCLTNIGITQMWFGQYGEAIRTLTSAYTLYQTQPMNLQLETPILHNLANVHSANGDPRLAIEVMQTAYQSAVTSKNARFQAMASLNLGMFFLEAGHPDQARAPLQSALQLSQKSVNQVIEMHALDGLGTLYLQVGELEQAHGALQAALNLALKTGSKQAELEARLQLGKLYLRQNDLAVARQELEAGLQLATEVQSVKEQGTAHEVLAEVFQHSGNLELSLMHTREVLRIERELFNAERDRQTRNLSIQFEVTRARHEMEMYRVRTDLERQGREAAEKIVWERTAELAQAQQEVVTRLAMAAEYRDDTTGEHTRRVGRAAASIALALGWSKEQAGVLSVAARLHDVGKIGIPDSVLLKAGKLDANEYRQMQTHTFIGSRILSGGRSELLRMAEEIARTHHERWDGGGYPEGLEGEQIPLTGRIVALADVFDALTQARPYKTAWTPEQAAEEIARQRGTHFDPTLVDLALPILTQHDPRDVLVEDELIPLTQEDTNHVLTVFEELLVERTRELEQARQAAVQAAERMASLARTDSLTGLGNRRAFDIRMDQMLERASREGLELTVAALDLDGLKAVNDRSGHAHGDAFLQAFASAFKKWFGTLGEVYRLGGDEFVVLIPGNPGTEALHKALEGAQREVKHVGFPVATASLGSAAFPGDARTAGDLLHLSDQRMYEVKLARREKRGASNSI
ncbi:HD domain-containing phosphohydrolase [Deinococcus hopiensis]|uniref:Diguanylate cyclase (GGDEF) domain-containing protein n=1 Tax=Deinococcus hopiensis KR-140 TaxID=695939 RepID=A0A1W1UP81_9DEIO|nr:HD domain-containing phosphohydrolase [Deinococcus hopiensis]SMB82887.1 diguanylate cyclase (GGDEF) domain-containing protein [Deinococcus hopiensis KR-140]